MYIKFSPWYMSLVISCMNRRGKMVKIKARVKEYPDEDLAIRPAVCADTVSMVTGPRALIPTAIPPCKHALPSPVVPVPALVGLLVFLLF